VVIVAGVMTEIPKSGLKSFVARLAIERNVQIETSNHSSLARIITRLSGDDVIPDETERLIIALRNAKVIDDKLMVEMLGNYFNELNKNRSESDS
jgi:hypothetical protein